MKNDVTTRFDFLYEYVKTKQGIVDLIIGLSIWSIVLVNFRDPVWTYLTEFFAGYPPGVNIFLPYLSFGLIGFVSILIISYFIEKVVFTKDFRKVLK